MGVVASGGAVILYKQQADARKEIKAEYEQRLQEAEKLLQQEQAIKKTVVVSAGELKAGEKLTEADLKTVQIAETDAPVNMIQNVKDLVGKVVKIDVGENTPIISSMVFDEGPTPRDLRLHEYNVIILPTKLQKGQYVDVRITFPTGEDFVVLSKKKVHDFEGTTVWYDINESELLVMSSAIVDAYLHGAKLYAITYVDPFMQDKAIPNYPANVKVMDLIQSDPNVLEKASEQLRAIARKALENNLSQLNEEERMKIQNGSLILQQQVANNQLTNQQNNQAVRQSQSEVASPSSSGVPVSPQSQPQATTGNSTVVPKDEIVKPIDKDDEEAFKQKQREIFEQPLVK
jgi:hypothetical protein